MVIDYDEFRRTTWQERIAIFTALAADEKAELFRSQVAGWLERHRPELTDRQIEILGQAIEWTTPAVYVTPKPEHVIARMKDLESRARAVLTPAQVLDALTMQWGLT